jgi:hypothetical protein
MGLKLNKHFYGIPFYGVYAKITYIYGTKQSVNFTVEYYPSKEISDKQEPFLGQEVYTFQPSSEEKSVRWDKQAYRFAKTLEVFAEALDVLEEGQVA